MKDINAFVTSANDRLMNKMIYQSFVRS